MLLFVLLLTCFSQTQWKFRKGTGEIFSSGNFEDDYLPRGRGAHSQWGFTNLAEDRMTTFSLNDFWIYDIEGNVWKFAGGCDGSESESEQNRLGDYTEGQMFPGARYGSIAYHLDDKLFLYGGKGYTDTETQIVLADLWSIDLKDIDDSSSGSYNISEVYFDCVICEKSDEVSGSFSNDGNPGAKYMSTVWMVNPDEENAEVYFFGGSGYSEDGTYGFMNDMWKVDKDEFSFQVGGETPFAEGSFTGTVLPPSMYGASGWVYKGGRGLKTDGTTPSPQEDDLTYFNNLFSYKTSNKQWTFLGGDKDEVENSLGVGENLVNVDLGPKQISVSENTTSFNEFNWPGSRSFHFTFTYGKILWMVGGIGLETYPDGTQNGKPYSNYWQYDVDGKQWKVHENWLLPDGEGGVSETEDEYAETNHIGAKHLGSCYIRNKERSIHFMFGWGADSRNIKYGAYYDTLMATTDEVWELELDKSEATGGGGGGDANIGGILAAILVPIFFVVCLLIIVAVLVIVIVVIIIKKKQE